MKPFYFVWNVNGSNPMFQHPDEISANREAERLARLNPGQHFVVLESVSSFAYNVVQKTDLRPERIPF